ncbi:MULTISPECIES: WXG100 family type VII secretion target [unclassified Nocardia]|uniref:WXG100 family type VII secretion target n=1 Tax=unclassified Nocardia TaxID=2637762 RepID=UPI0033B19657
MVGFDDPKAPANGLLASGVDSNQAYYQEDVALLYNVGLNGDQKTGTPGVLKGTIAGDAWDVYGNFASGQVDAAMLGILGLAGSVMEVAYKVLDPFAFIGSQVAKWILDHVEFMRNALDELAGNPDIVEAYAKSWTKISTELTAVAADWKSSVEQDIDDWQGASGQQYRVSASSLIDQIDAASGIAATMGKSMESVSKAVDVVRTLVRDVLANLIGAAIGWTIELIATSGAAAAHVIPAALRRIARDTLTVSDMLGDLKKVFTDIKTLMEPIGKVGAILTGGSGLNQEQPQPA